ncbi:MAG: SpoIIIAH-like family protein [Firmicutes bacterium]|nr:SpoIIIAH-like family protein [Bacillota bacterium]
MLTKKKKIIVLCGMVALLVVTGVLNIVLNNNVGRDDEVGAYVHQTLFQRQRQERIANRNQQMLFYDAIINNEASSQAAIEAAEEGRMQLLATMEKERILEGLIQAVGFNDSFVTLNAQNQNINVVVRSESLTEDEANRILAIIVDETGRSAQHVIIIPVG